jgi:hypothetical protein
VNYVNEVSEIEGLGDFAEDKLQEYVPFIADTKVIDLDQEIRWGRDEYYDDSDIYMRMKHIDTLNIVGTEEDGYQWFIFKKDVKHYSEDLKWTAGSLELTCDSKEQDFCPDRDIFGNVSDPTPKSEAKSQRHIF